MARSTTSKTDTYTRITQQIIADLEKGVRPWIQPWKTASGPVQRPQRYTGQAYSGINTLILWAAAMQWGYLHPIWMTFRQAAALGGSVRKGEKSHEVVYTNTATRKTKNSTTDEDETTSFRFLKSYRVFNVDQIDGLPDHFYESLLPPANGSKECLTHVEDYFENLSIERRHGGSRAYYHSGRDFIQMPYRQLFDTTEAYGATLAHEIIHSTRHRSRLDRSFGCQRWGDAGYAMEELVAEIGSAFLCADLHITPLVQPDHAQYIDSWLTVLNGDKRAIFTAASHAQRAVDYLHQQQPTMALSETS